MNIKTIHARQILDSRGNPTVEADVVLEDGSFGRASVPSGASTGLREAVELRDGDPQFYSGMGVGRAVRNVNTRIAPMLTGMPAWDQFAIDNAMIYLDGTDNKQRLGANAILAVSLAVAKAAAANQGVELYRQIANIAGNESLSLPIPMMNILNGGKHAANSTDIQEFMVIPKGAETFEEAVHMGTQTFHALKKLLADKGQPTTVGDEGGFAPRLATNMEALELLMQAMLDAGYKAGEDMVVALDVAASELYEDGLYNLRLDGKEFTGQEFVDWYGSLLDLYPIASIEDGLDQNDWTGWQELTARLGRRVQLVGDDLLVTNTGLLRQGIEMQAGNAILIKPNQIGTLTETISAVKMAKEAGWKTVISHRSGETEDTAIAHLAVGLGAGQIKTGSLSRTDRVGKYNELLRISENGELQLSRLLD